MANLDELRRVLLEMASPNTLRDGVVTLLDDVRGLVASRERHRDTQVVHHARIDQLASGCSETSTRVDQLAAQLAGLQRLVESLVNERGEGRKVEDDHDRILDEVLAERDFRCEQIDAIADALGDEGEWSNLHDRGVAALLIADGIVPEVGRLRAEVERLTRERDEAIRGSVVIVTWTAETIATWLERAAEAATIPTGNPARPFTPDSAARSAALVRAADGIRAGEWKP